MIVLILAIVAAVLAIVVLIQTRAQELLAWGLLAVAAALILGSRLV